MIFPVGFFGSSSTKAIFGSLYGARFFLAVFRQFLLGRRHTRFQGDKGLRDLALDRVRHADDRRFTDGPVRMDDLFYLFRVDVVAARYDQLLFPADNEEIPVIISVRVIPGMDPPVPYLLPRLIGEFEVSLRGVRTPEDEASPLHSAGIRSRPCLPPWRPLRRR